MRLSLPVQLRGALTLVFVSMLLLPNSGCDTKPKTSIIAGSGSGSGEGDSAREELSESASKYFARLQTGQTGSIGPEWDLETLRETAYAEKYLLLDPAQQAAADTLLERELSEILAHPSLVERLAGVTIKRTEVDRQDDEIYWVELSLEHEGKELGELFFYAKKVDDQWRWTDLGRVGYSLGSELETLVAVDGKPLEEHLETLSDHASKLALIYHDPKTLATPEPAPVIE